MADHQLPRELMESCLAASQEATFAGFDDSVLASEFADPKRRRLMETIYRMGFESGWRIREQQITHGVAVDASTAEGSRMDDAQKLAEAIAKAAQKAGIYNGETPLTGPHLLILLDDMATAASGVAPTQGGQDA